MYFVYERDSTNEVEELKKVVKDAGYSVQSSDSVKLGESITEELHKVLSEEGPVVLCATKVVMGSSWTDRIVNITNMPFDKPRLFAIQMEEGTSLRSLPKDLTKLDYWESPERACKELVDALKKYYPLETSGESHDQSDKPRQFVEGVTDIMVFDEDAVRRFRGAFDRDKGILAAYPPHLSAQDFLLKAKLAVGSRLRRAGVLFFGRKEHLDAVVHCTEYAGTRKESGRVLKTDFRDSIPMQIEAAYGFLLDSIDSHSFPTTDKAAAQKYFQYPMNCIREVISNALIHRDYEDPERDVHVRKFIDRVEVLSPGSWIGHDLSGKDSLSLEELKVEGSVKRNALLAQVAALSGHVEGEGSGIPTSIADCENINAPIPSVCFTREGFVRVSIYPRPDWEEFKLQLEAVVSGELIDSLRSDDLSNEIDATPSPPEFYAEPPYIGSHQFVGRDAELQTLSDWAKPADPTNLLLFEAIGGNGKSMLTWEWTTKHSEHVGQNWQGRFWYSFYERGAQMADFCRRALAYMTGQPLEELRKKKTTALVEPLLDCLHEKPWLLILDGLERVLVAYHRMDAAELRDEDVDEAKDQIAQREPRDAIRDEDNELLRSPRRRSTFEGPRQFPASHRGCSSMLQVSRSMG